MRTGAVVVAAGMSRRMNDFKQLMKVGELTMAERVITTISQAGVNDIVVVTGYRAEEVEAELQRFSVAFVRNDNYETTQMFDSAKLGLSYLKDTCDRILFTPVDIPFFSVNTVKMLLEEDGDIIIPIYEGRQGHPLCMKASLVPEILNYSGERGLKGAIDALRDHSTCKLVNVSDPGSIMDADTKEDYKILKDYHDAGLMRPLLRLRIAKNKPFFGPGTVTLLRQIDRTGSVLLATKMMGMSYSKGRKMIKEAEEELGYPIVISKVGGSAGGLSTISDKGRELLKKYEQFEAEVWKETLRIYKNIFNEDVKHEG